MRTSIRLILICVFVLAAQSAWAVCGVDEVCVDIPANASAQDIADAIKGSWDLPDFACSADITETGVRVTSGFNGGTRVLQFVVPVSGTGFAHAVRLRFALPLSRLPEPFRIWFKLDGDDEVLLPNGPSQFADITVNVSTLNLTEGSGGGAALPAMKNAGTLALIIGLLGGGIGILLFTRKTH